MLDGFLSREHDGSAQEAKLLEIKVHNLRDWTTDKHNTTDDRPFGGGAGMCEMSNPSLPRSSNCKLRAAGASISLRRHPVSPALALELSQQTHLVLLSGHYEGIDQRIRKKSSTRRSASGLCAYQRHTCAAVVIDALAALHPRRAR